LAFSKLSSAKRLFARAFRLFHLADSILSSDFRKLTLAKRKLTLASSILSLAVSILTLAATDKHKANQQDSPSISHAFAHTLRFCPAQGNPQKSAKSVQAHARVRPSSDSNIERPFNRQESPLNSMAAANSGFVKCGVQWVSESIVILSYIYP
jgi:hypothetical protein